jgi:hypothetical protein
MYNVIVNISEIKIEEKLNVSVMSINYSNVNFFLPNWLFYYLAILPPVTFISKFDFFDTLKNKCI